MLILLEFVEFDHPNGLANWICWGRTGRTCSYVLPKK